MMVALVIPVFRARCVLGLRPLPQRQYKNVDRVDQQHIRSRTITTTKTKRHDRKTATYLTTRQKMQISSTFVLVQQHMIKKHQFRARAGELPAPPPPQPPHMKK